MHADASLYDSRIAAAVRGGKRSTSTRAQSDGHLQSADAPRFAGGAPDRLAVTFPADADAPQRARAAASRALAHWTPERRDVALLVISELVTNAVRHGARDDADEVGLLVRRRGAATRIEVIDPRAGRGMVDDGGSAAGTEIQRSGWGLPIVAELTDRWGVEGGPGRTCVWCELDDA
ncbi:ATP-binding protein [Conexibacter sp. JD483]|uniref:ATP-binding protein n=1 Tax=unclassified Conexibacter TaxID=2627773 RepID=UPI002719C013|nr:MULTISPECIES: ATP-binding protein [unclassified Conexibacter]MDO8185410.1 ATP-binding protein [Conexibacter sp. CPCC 205706]MDO8198414.1 ATP-binding protein [Conexibacter sp. CPCC 205762]MDR9369376.1 ATP-binding protein [Conexibacter sp. JD483]